MRIYIAGPMRGYPHSNFPAFDDWEATLRLWGHSVTSPAAKVREMWPDHDWEKGVPRRFDPRKQLALDLQMILCVDAVFFMVGWTESKGALVEHAWADFCGIDRVYEVDHQRADTLRVSLDRLAFEREAERRLRAGLCEACGRVCGGLCEVVGCCPKCKEHRA